MKGCELCSNQARIYCDSDQARLCWDCDKKVHCANFLVAKHSRSLLCHVCQTPTPWKASGPKLGPTISVCENCFDGTTEQEMMNHHHPQIRTHHVKNLEESCDSESAANDGDYSTSSSEYNDDDDDDDDDDGPIEDEHGDDDDDGENQVVPWSCCSSSAPSSSPQPPLATSSSSEDIVRDGGATVTSSFKKMRHAAILDSDDEDGCSSGLNLNAASMECEMPSSSSSWRPVKRAKTSELIDQIKGEITDQERRRLGIVRSLIRFQQNVVDGEVDASAIIHGISKMSRRDS